SDLQSLKSVLVVAAGCGLLAAGTADAPGPAIGVRAIIHSVADLDKTVAFYRDGLGMKPDPLPKASALNEDLSKFTDTHGAKFRNAILHIPGAAFTLELTEFSGITLKKAVPHMQDPGAATLVLTVRDVDVALAGVKKTGGAGLSNGGEPVKKAETSQSPS